MLTPPLGGAKLIQPIFSPQALPLKAPVNVIASRRDSHDTGEIAVAA